MIAVVVGCLAEAIGYGLRILSARKPDNLGLYVASILPILLAPIVIALGAYLTAAFLVKRLGRRVSLLSPKVFERAFVAADVVSFVVQAIGGSLFAKPNPTLEKIAKVILVVGLTIALVSFTIFLFNVFVVHRRSRSTAGRWRLLFVAIYVNAVCLIIRSAYRLVEFSSGRNGYVSKHEYLFYLLDSIPIAIACCTWAFLHPAFFKVPSTVSGISEVSPGPSNL